MMIRDVGFNVYFLASPIGADGALEWLLPLVNEIMGSEIAFQLELLFANGAAEFHEGRSWLDIDQLVKRHHPTGNMEEGARYGG